MRKRKFYHGDAVRMVQGDSRLHYGHAGEVSGIRISILPTHRNAINYAVSCECGANLRAVASDLDHIWGTWHGIENARLEYWYHHIGLPAPADAEVRLAEGLSLLTDREQEILSSRYGWYGRDHKTLEKLGQDFGVTRERIRQIEYKAHRKVRAHLRGGANGDR